jgi:putative nucleotidyltransferase with HDIG domain
MLKTVTRSQLRVGMFVCKQNASWLAHPFWRNSYVIKDADMLRVVVESGASEFVIDTDKGRDVDEHGETSLNTLQVEPVETPPSSATPNTRVELSEEQVAARRILDRSASLVRDLFGEARLGRLVSTSAARAVVDDIAISLQRNPWALLSVARIKSADAYTYLHSTAVCALMVALARQLGMAEEAVQEAGYAGLLHDLGKVAIPDRILNKPGGLTDAEFKLVQSHPLAGARLLRSVPGLPPAVIDVCAHHHEKLDGTGYPHRLSGEQISKIARMGAICDIYDAVTSARAYKPAWNPAQALRSMTAWSSSQLDRDLLYAFIKCVGIYPIHSLVRLESGFLAIVVDQNDQSLLQPRVRAFFCTRTRSFVPSLLIDLSDASSGDHIVGPEDPMDWGLGNTDDLDLSDR